METDDFQKDLEPSEWISLRIEGSTAEPVKMVWMGGGVGGGRVVGRRGGCLGCGR